MGYLFRVMTVVVAVSFMGCATKGTSAPIDTSNAWSASSEEQGDSQLLERKLNEDVLPEQLFGAHLIKEGVLEFERGSTELPEYLQEQVRQFGRIHLAPQEWVEEGWEYQLVVVGHTDATGTLEVNKIVGQKRADHIRKLLLEGGVPAERVTATSATPGQGRYIEFLYEVLDD